MTYKITIESCYDVETTEQGAWVTVEKRPLTQQEYLDSYTSAREQKAEVLYKEVKGYAPPVKTTREVRTKIFEQVCASDFNLLAVIAAVNGLKA